MKLPKLLIAILGVLLVGFGSALAQENDNNQSKGSPFSVDDINNPGIDFNKAQEDFGLDYFLTLTVPGLNSGSDNGGNVAIIEQVGDDNTAEITQTGNNLYSQIKQDGNRNTALVEQRGNRLVSLVDMVGDNNYLEFTQTGSNKGALFEFRGDNMQYEAHQRGAGVSFSPSNSTMPPINIETTRESLPVIISRN